MITCGVHSAAGKLRRVMVHKPGSAVARLTPPNCAKVLFDDVIWVKQARSARMTVVDATRNHAGGVVFLRPMLAVTLSGLAARRGSPTTLGLLTPQHTKPMFSSFPLPDRPYPSPEPARPKVASFLARRNPPPFATRGQPAKAQEWLPVGIPVASRFGDDERLVALCAKLERAPPESARCPKLD